MTTRMAMASGEGIAYRMVTMDKVGVIEAIPFNSLTPDLDKLYPYYYKGYTVMVVKQEDIDKANKKP